MSEITQLNLESGQQFATPLLSGFQSLHIPPDGSSLETVLRSEDGAVVHLRMTMAVAVRIAQGVEYYQKTNKKKV